MREEEDYVAALEAFSDDKYVIIELWGKSIDHLRITVIGKEETPYEGG